MIGTYHLVLVLLVLAVSRVCHAGDNDFWREVVEKLTPSAQDGDEQAKILFSKLESDQSQHLNNDAAQTDPSTSIKSRLNDAPGSFHPVYNIPDPSYPVGDAPDSFYHFHSAPGSSHPVGDAPDSFYHVHSAPGSSYPIGDSLPYDIPGSSHPVGDAPDSFYHVHSAPGSSYPIGDSLPYDIPGSSHPVGDAPDSFYHVHSAPGSSYPVGDSWPYDIPGSSHPVGDFLPYDIPGGSYFVGDASGSYHHVHDASGSYHHVHDASGFSHPVDNDPGSLQAVYGGSGHSYPFNNPSDSFGPVHAASSHSYPVGDAVPYDTSGYYYGQHSGASFPASVPHDRDHVLSSSLAGQSAHVVESLWKPFPANDPFIDFFETSTGERMIPNPLTVQERVEILDSIARSNDMKNTLRQTIAHSNLQPFLQHMTKKVAAEALGTNRGLVYQFSPGIYIVLRPQNSDLTHGDFETVSNPLNHLYVWKRSAVRGTVHSYFQYIGLVETARRAQRAVAGLPGYYMKRSFAALDQDWVYNDQPLYTGQGKGRGEG